MISLLTGPIRFRNDKLIIIEANGVGYRVYISTETRVNLPSDNETITLWTHLAVREDALDLYGFSSKQELDFFELLISVSGVGPKSALGILGLAGVTTLEKAIAGSDVSYLTKISGIGKKTAEKIILELRDKLGAINSEGLQAHLSAEADVVAALESMGYRQTEIRDALKKIDDSATDTNTKIKQALKYLHQ